jgi:cytochrome d ubiquinol oxidase subunit II
MGNLSYNAKTGPYSLRVGMIWWLIGIALAVGYFTFLYRSFRGKVDSRQGRAAG